MKISQRITICELLQVLVHTVVHKGIYGTTNPPGIDWSQWWTYDGISGPRFWGVINPEWVMCRDGRRQSPINIDPKTLLFDPNLTPFSMDKIEINGVLVNTGHSVEWRASDQQSTKNSSSSSSSSTRRKSSTSTQRGPNITGGPLSYVYTLTHVRIHFGERDNQGSEHTLDGFTFPAELQMFGYNSQLYKNFSHAVGQVNGVVAVAILIKIGNEMSPEFQLMLEGIESIIYGGSYMDSTKLSISNLLPSTEHYMTYEGSLTEPGCHETVTWIIPNKPIYISIPMMRHLRSLRQGKQEPLSNAPIANNFRPIQTAHHRTIRTNISVNKDSKDSRCNIPDSRLVYKAGTWLGS